MKKLKGLDIIPFLCQRNAISPCNSLEYSWIEPTNILLAVCQHPCPQPPAGKSRKISHRYNSNIRNPVRCMQHTEEEKMNKKTINKLYAGQKTEKEMRVRKKNFFKKTKKTMQLKNNKPNVELIKVLHPVSKII